MQLKITNLRGQIGINSHSPAVSIRQPKAELRIETKPSVLNIKTKHVKIKIDQTQCFNEMGLKNNGALTRSYAAESRKDLLAAIQRMVGEGNRMARIENKTNAIAEIAKGHLLPPPADFNITLMPKSRPKIRFEGGISLNPVQGSVNLQAAIEPVRINATRGYVEIYLLQKPYFRLEFIGGNTDITV